MLRPLLCASLFAILGSCSSSSKGGDPSFRVMAAGTPRTYSLHIPETLAHGQAAPLVIVFHGSGDVGAGIASMTGFNAVADREGFVVAYPDAFDHNWNDGREVASIFSQSQNINDIAFTDKVIEDVSGRQAIDTHRIYATGFSNGGLFCHFLAAQRAKTFAAIAAVGGGIAEPFTAKFHPEAALSVFVIHGTLDPFVPYAGGEVDYSNNGRVLPMEQTLRLWRESLGCADQPEKGDLPDRDAADCSTVKWSRWSGGKTGPELLLYSVVGGGHAWPGGPQFQPVEVIGHVCRDFNATEAIWEFFKKHPK